jgi:hypothetical protein
MKSDYCQRIKSLFSHQSAGFISSTINESKDAKVCVTEITVLHDCMMVLKFMEGSTAYILEYQMSSCKCQKVIANLVTMREYFFLKNILNELSPAKFKCRFIECRVMILSLTSKLDLIESFIFTWTFLILFTRNVLQFNVQN